MAAKKKTQAKSKRPPAKKKTAAASSKGDVEIVYEETGALFADEIIVNSGNGRVLLDFSTGVITDVQNDRRILPVQARVAVTPQNAVKLIRTLTAVMQQQQAKEE